jgi:hypothetical protein
MLSKVDRVATSLNDRQWSQFRMSRIFVGKSGRFAICAPATVARMHHDGGM